MPAFADGPATGHQVRVDPRVVLSSVESEEYRHDSAHHGLRSTDREVQDVLSTWCGIGGTAFGGRWDDTGANLTNTLSNWSARNGKARESMGDYTGQDSDSAEDFEAVSDEMRAFVAKINL